MSKKDLSKNEDMDNKATEGNIEDTNVSESHDEEMVNIFLFKDKDKYNSDLPVSINGKTWLIQRGVNVQVPRFVAEVINNSMIQDAKGSELLKIQEEKFS